MIRLLPVEALDEGCAGEAPLGATVREHQAERPEETLLVAVLEQCVRDLKHQRASVRTAAREWLASDSTHAWGYWWVCSMLHLDHSFVRQRLATSPTTTLPRRATPTNKSGLKFKQRTAPTRVAA